MEWEQIDPLLQNTIATAYTSGQLRDIPAYLDQARVAFPDLSRDTLVDILGAFYNHCYQEQRRHWADVFETAINQAEQRAQTVWRGSEIYHGCQRTNHIADLALFLMTQRLMRERNGYIPLLSVDLAVLHEEIVAALRAEVAAIVTSLEGEPASPQKERLLALLVERLRED